MDYQRRFEEAIDQLKREERYRVFADLERDATRFPLALWRPPGEEHAPRQVTVWCSNDYLGMGGRPEVIEAAVAANGRGGGRGSRLAVFRSRLCASANFRRASPASAGRPRRARRPLLAGRSRVPMRRRKKRESSPPRTRPI